MTIQLKISGNYLIANIESETSETREILFPRSNSFYSNIYNTPIFDSKIFDDERQLARNTYANAVVLLTVEFNAEVKLYLKNFDEAIAKNDTKAMQEITNKLADSTQKYNDDLIKLKADMQSAIDIANANEQKALGATTPIQLLAFELKNNTFGNKISMTVDMIKAGNVKDALNIAYDLETLPTFLQQNTGGIGIPKL